MKITIVRLSLIAGVAAMLCGCGESKSSAPASEPKAAAPADNTAQNSANPLPAPATPAAPAVAAPPAPPAAPAAPAAATAAVTPPAPPATAQSANADPLAEFVASAKSQADPQLSSLGTELADKVKSLQQSASGNSAVQSQLDTSMKSLTAGNDAGALSSAYQTAQSANLTPQQLQLAKDVGNVASAYVVQKNFASLDGAQSDVATIVNSLRKGEITPAIPAIQKVGQNASLTPPQKQLIASIADKYAPGMSKAASTLQQGLQSVPGLGGSSK
jgi:hypothetical protein